jgi:hypothetical protein
LKLEVLLDVTLYQLVTSTSVPCHTKRLELFYPEEEGIGIFRNVRKYLPVDTIQHSRKSNHQQNRYAKFKELITKNKQTP